MAFRPARLWALRAIYRFVLHPGRGLYLRCFKPRTFGARLLVTDPVTARILLIRQTYGRRDIWLMPGGGYNPKAENADAAAIREAYEETGVHVTNVQHLLRRDSRSMGNVDQVQAFTADLDSQDQIMSAEVAEVRWVSREDASEMNLAVLTCLALAESARKLDE